MHKLNQNKQGTVQAPDEGGFAASSLPIISESKVHEGSAQTIKPNALLCLLFHLSKRILVATGLLFWRFIKWESYFEKE